MISKKNIILTCMTVIGAALLVLTQTAGSNQNQQSNKLEGAWICKVPGTPMRWTLVMSPDPSGRRATINGSIQVHVPFDLMYPGVVPGGIYPSDYVGEAVMTGPYTAKVTCVGYAMKNVLPSAAYPFYEQVAWMYVVSGELKFTAPGKFQIQSPFALYLPSADADGDGLPDAGQTPIVSMPAGFVGTRVGF